MAGTRCQMLGALQRDTRDTPGELVGDPRNSEEGKTLHAFPLRGALWKCFDFQNEYNLKNISCFSIFVNDRKISNKFKFTFPIMENLLKVEFFSRQLYIIFIVTFCQLLLSEKRVRNY